MWQMGFLGFAECLDGLDERQDTLIEINDTVPWDEFRPILEQAWRKPRDERKSPVGRKPFDEVVMPRC